MNIRYLTNIMDPILDSSPEFRRNVKDILVSQQYSVEFTKGKFRKNDFRYLLSDNGNFTRLNKIAKKHLPEAEKLKKKAEFLLLNKKPLNAAVKKERVALNKKIISECEAELKKTDYSLITREQLSIAPNGIIGAENTTIPVLQICGAFDPVFKGLEPSLQIFQNKTFKLYQSQYSGKFGGAGVIDNVEKFLVLHAIDYNSMVKAALRLEGKKFDAVAVSLGGALAKKNYISEVKAGKQLIKFNDTHPESYISTVMLLLAIRNTVSNTVPVHILGLGTPVLILLAAYIFKNFKQITIDSTASYKDVEVNCIYGNKNGLYKMDISKLAAYCIVNKTEFRGISPYYKYYSKRHPSNWKKFSGRFSDILSDSTLSTTAKQKKIQDKLVKNPSLFLNAADFFAPIALLDKKLKPEVRIARSFENYWVNNRLCEKLNSFSSVKKLEQYIEDELIKFEQFGSKNYIDAIKASIFLINSVK